MRSDKLQEDPRYAFRLAFDTGRFRPMGVDSYVNTADPELSALSPIAAAQLAAHAVLPLVQLPRLGRS